MQKTSTPAFLLCSIRNPTLCAQAGTFTKRWALGYIAWLSLLVAMVYASVTFYHTASTLSLITPERIRHALHVLPDFEYQKKQLTLTDPTWTYQAYGNTFAMHDTKLTPSSAAKRLKQYPYAFILGKTHWTHAFYQTSGPKSSIQASTIQLLPMHLLMRPLAFFLAPSTHQHTSLLNTSDNDLALVYCKSKHLEASVTHMEQSIATLKNYYLLFYTIVFSVYFLSTFCYALATSVLIYLGITVWQAPKRVRKTPPVSLASAAVANAIPFCLMTLNVLFAQFDVYALPERLLFYFAPILSFAIAAWAMGLLRPTTLQPTRAKLRTSS